MLTALQAARHYGCEVDTLTLSIEQKKLAEERIKAAGLENRIRVHLLDYREIPAEFEKAFDAFVSVEMLEVSYILLFSDVTKFLIETSSMSEQNIITSTSNLSTLLSNPKMRRPLSLLPPSLNQDIQITSMLMTVILWSYRLSKRH